MDYLECASQCALSGCPVLMHESGCINLVLDIFALKFLSGFASLETNYEKYASIEIMAATISFVPEESEVNLSDNKVKRLCKNCTLQSSIFLIPGFSVPGFPQLSFAFRCLSQFAEFVI